MEYNPILTEIKTCGSTLIFRSTGGGMADRIVHEATGDTAISSVPSGGELTVILDDGRILHPDASAAVPEVYEENGAQVVEFIDLPWRDNAGKLIPDFHLALKHEVNPDGVMFTTAMFHAETSNPPAVKSFTLTKKLCFKAFDDIRYAVLARHGNFESQEMQSCQDAGFLQAGEITDFKNNLMTQAAFYARRQNGPSLYAELFLEGGATLSGNIMDGASHVRWNESDAEVVWNFQTAVFSCKRPYQWRNRWGSVIAPPPDRRKLPPRKIYQYIDNYRHYPTGGELDTLAKAGCDILVLHSNWRRDAKNGGTPYNLKRFREIVDFAHQHDMRIAVYVRGNETALKEDAAIWFDRYLKKNYDGLYVDYGCPCALFSSPDEDYPGGIVHYRGLYDILRRLRNRIGEKGILISHTGAAFSNVGMAFCDNYISGEAERGMLLKGRMEYEYFTKVAAASGTLWSAAFPEYATTAIIPFLASSGQAPHNPLGVQFKSSSLQHPPEPGVNDHAFRPLWKLWSLFRNEENIRVFNDYNSSGIFTADSGSHGHYLMVSQDNSRALLIISRFGTAQSQTSIDWEKAGFNPAGGNIWRLCPDIESPGKPEDYSGDAYSIELSAYPAGAFLFSHKPEDFSDYLRPYPATGASGKAYLEEIKNQRQLRELGKTGELYLSLELDNSIRTALENSNFFDLYDSILQLVEFDNNGNCQVLGVIGKNGFHLGGTDFSKDKLLPGDVTSEIPLHEYSEKGKHLFGIRTLHFGEPFYSFVSVVLKYGGRKSKLEFYNDVEPDRSLIRFAVEFI